jgi:hypothetical protein
MSKRANGLTVRRMLVLVILLTLGALLVYGGLHRTQAVLAKEGGRQTAIIEAQESCPEEIEDGYGQGAGPRRDGGGQGRGLGNGQGSWKQDEIY